MALLLHQDQHLSFFSSRLIRGREATTLLLYQVLSFNEGRGKVAKALLLNNNCPERLGGKQRCSSSIKINRMEATVLLLHQVGRREATCASPPLSPTINNN